MNKIVILGSTGSIGRQTLEIIDQEPEYWQVIALTAATSIELLIRQAKKYRPRYLVIGTNELAQKLKHNLKDFEIEILVGRKGLEMVASLPEVELVINGIMGADGLAPSYAALKADKRLGLANKESMVIGGQLLVRQSGEILPIDSEHNALFQILKGHKQNEVENILLTASGGPFFAYEYQQLQEVTVEEALDHPNWDMGKKITIDSATMMNKGLEVIEAHWLFDIPYDKIKVVIHPESIVHSLVEFIDYSIQAELGVSDMKLPIQQVMYYPQRQKSVVRHLNLEEIGRLTFYRPDYEKFPALELAYECGQQGRSMPVALNAANEVAVAAFLDRKISFLQIIEIVSKVLNNHRSRPVSQLEEIYYYDNLIREKTREVIADVDNGN